jgi:hypothetical protein
MTSIPITVQRGLLHFSRDAYERVFTGAVESVVLLREGPDLVVFPVRHAAAGGYVVKQRNVVGDRVVDAIEFLRANGIDDGDEFQVVGNWSEASICLTVPAFFTDN